MTSKSQVVWPLAMFLSSVSTRLLSAFIFQVHLPHHSLWNMINMIPTPGPRYLLLPTHDQLPDAIQVLPQRSLYQESLSLLMSLSETALSYHFCCPLLLFYFLLRTYYFYVYYFLYTYCLSSPCLIKEEELCLFLFTALSLLRK